MIPFNSGSPQAAATADLFIIVLIVAALVLILVTGVVLVSAVRFRHRAGDDREPVQIEGNLRLEIMWTAAPVLILASVTWLMVETMGSLRPAGRGDAQPEIIVTGYQWWWEVAYPQAGFVTANEIHIPSGRPVLLRLEGGDVIHSFWVPELGGKADMIPGQSVLLSLEATAPGTYLGACSEYCGTQHAWMRLRVVAHSPVAYDAWLAAQQERPALPAASGDAGQGARLFTQSTCVNCHAIQGTGSQARIGPDLTHLAGRETLAAGVMANTPQNLARWLRNPQAVKPGNHMPDFHFKEDEIRMLVAYLETLR